MDKLLLQPTTTASWYSLLNDAQALNNTYLSHELESYLVFLLMRFTEQPELSASILAIEYLESQQQLSSKRNQDLQTVADKCLLFSGLFPERAQKIRVEIDYFINLGRSAFWQLALDDQYYMQHVEGFEIMSELLNMLRKLDDASTKPYNPSDNNSNNDLIFDLSTHGRILN